MPEETVVKVAHLVTALDNIHVWCGVIRDALLKLDQNQEILVSTADVDRILGKPPNALGGCKPP